jgi:hypothetical protein
MRIPVWEVNSNPKVDRRNSRQSLSHCEGLVAKGWLSWIDPNDKSKGCIETRTRGTHPDNREQVDRSTRGTDTSASAMRLQIPLKRSTGSCEVCGFSRVIEKAHIVPARFGGSTASYNMLELCPNHHTLFDRNELTHGEFQAIWPKVSAAINMRSTDPMLQEWRTSIAAKYGLSLLPS